MPKRNPHYIPSESESETLDVITQEIKQSDAEVVAPRIKRKPRTINDYPVDTANYTDDSSIG